MSRLNIIRLLPIWVTMKFSTALSFFLSGFVLMSLSQLEADESAVAQTVLPVATLTIVLLMGTLLASTLLGVRSGVEDFFVKEAEGAVDTTTPGRPSVGTMVCFLLIVFAGLYRMYNSNRGSARILAHLGQMVVVLGVAAILGYTVSVPALYYTVEDLSTAMASHTAILFVLLGIGMALLGRHGSSDEH